MIDHETNRLSAQAHGCSEGIPWWRRMFAPLFRIRQLFTKRSGSRKVSAGVMEMRVEEVDRALREIEYRADGKPAAAPAADGNATQKLTGVSDSLKNTAALLRQVAAQMQQSVETQRRVNERLAELRDRIRNTTERMKRNRVNIDLTEAKRQQEQKDQLLRRRPTNRDRMNFHEYIEFSGIDEYQRFRQMGPITDEDLTRLRQADWFLADDDASGEDNPSGRD